MAANYLQSAIRQFEYYKSLGDKTFEQLSAADFSWQYNDESNSIAIIVKHLAGNMISRWTDFLTTDGEKPWRDRESEFTDTFESTAAMQNLWETGWRVLFRTLHSLTQHDLDKIIFIRNERHTVVEAINRQLAHYSYHVGQIVLIGKMRAANWKSLTIPRGGSQRFNENKFSQPT